MYAIEAHSLTKVYRIYADPKDRLKEFLLRGRRKYHQEFWALREVTFRAPVGSTFGLIGDNGSGKSTLLQLLAGTLTPTMGTAQVSGRISAILELGAGFNPEFTGRENAFMSGAIMGIDQREMQERFKEIVPFAEIGDFIDRPVRMYSTGMYLRLAFAVATSVDPEVLILDEALSVGDQYFQKRCIDRIEAFRKAGKTILFCSHNTYQVRMICDQVIWLRDGRVAMIGETLKVVAEYESYLRDRIAEKAPSATVSRPSVRDLGPNAAPWISKAYLIVNGQAMPHHDLQTGNELAVAVSYEVPRPPTTVHVGVRISRSDGIECYGIATHLDGVAPPPTSGRVILRFPDLQLLAGEYYVDLFLFDETGVHYYEEIGKACSFWVSQSFIAVGMCQLKHEWSVEALPEGGTGQERSFAPKGAAERGQGEADPEA
jgi:ABC-type polysaccharide/polyol phosphate transport system ATPase subunit